MHVIVPCHHHLMKNTSLPFESKYQLGRGGSTGRCRKGGFSGRSILKVNEDASRR